MALGGCQTAVPPSLRLASESPEDRRLQTRHFSGVDEAAVAAAGVSALQQLGFVLDESSLKLGTLTASKGFPQKKVPPAEAALAAAVGAGLLMFIAANPAILAVTLPRALTASGKPTGQPDRVRVTLVLSSSPDHGGINVRATFQKNLVNRSQSPRAETAEVLRAPEVYEEFFRQLAKDLTVEPDNLLERQAT
jgi:hypothetical protein